MASLTHPSIQDGWFREISSEWPGQAMILKANRILHVEQSLHQDVLVFESATYGNVLVLDGVIQCTERDEFSYQEMIAHLPLTSHPDPKRVLVIGGGDGGVVREVLKHGMVEQIVLCEIDEAVIRISKMYLPQMSALLSSPKVTVHIADGFQFLATHEDTYDVIITDSSDPVGPAARLFEKPYFELLHNALAPGGHISTQAECMWLRLDLVRDLLAMASDVFASAAYAYTTVPTYTSGQIGVIICAKAPGNDLRTPLRAVQDTRYYNQALHLAAFNLPEFARVFLEEGKDIRPVLRSTMQCLEKKPTKKELLGCVGSACPCAECLPRNKVNTVSSACHRLDLRTKFATAFTCAISPDKKDSSGQGQDHTSHQPELSGLKRIAKLNWVEARLREWGLRILQLVEVTWAMSIQ